MAGAKETPRQKLISLMYLVLLAMLALQVSSAVIFKFEQLNKNLELSNANTEVYNKSKLANINSEISSREDLGKTMALLNKAQTLRKETDALKQYMGDLKSTLIEKTGGYDDEGNLTGAKEETKVEVYMIGPSKNGKAYELKTKLDKHVDYLNTLNLGDYHYFAFDGKDHPILMNKKDQKIKDFANLNFAASPLVASLATLSELESTVLKMERRALDAIADSVDVQDYKVKGLIPVVKTNSNYVVAGQPYKAELFLTAQLATETPSMNLGEQKLEVDNRGIGAVNFKANGGNYDANGLAKRTWKGEIHVKKPNGQDTTYVIEQEYTVVKPTLEIGVATTPTLYKNCGNKLKVAVPQLGNSFNPKYQVTGAKIVQGQRGEITVIPNARNVTIKVSSDGVPVGHKTYRVEPVPLPFIVAEKDGRSINPITGIGLADLNKVKIKIEANENFEKLLPQEAQYGGIKWVASLVRAGRKKAPDVTGTGSRLKLRNGFSNAQSGDLIVVEIIEFKRRNYVGNTEKVNMSLDRRIIKIPIN